MDWSRVERESYVDMVRVPIGVRAIFVTSLLCLALWKCLGVVELCHFLFSPGGQLFTGPVISTKFMVVMMNFSMLTCRTKAPISPPREYETSWVVRGETDPGNAAQHLGKSRSWFSWGQLHWVVARGG
ncbi:hypothetical protein C8R45DRAFT_946342 [Mycena sanguinolenta]|nr:hypothetical protein C8R45DRAFT_946342 [Mycena sanguinolenta]